MSLLLLVEPCLLVFWLLVNLICYFACEICCPESASFAGFENCFNINVNTLLSIVRPNNSLTCFLYYSISKVLAFPQTRLPLRSGVTNIVACPHDALLKNYP